MFRRLERSITLTARAHFSINWEIAFAMNITGVINGIRTISGASSSNGKYGKNG